MPPINLVYVQLSLGDFLLCPDRKERGEIQKKLNPPVADGPPRSLEVEVVSGRAIAVRPLLPALILVWIPPPLAIFGRIGFGSLMLSPLSCD